MNVILAIDSGNSFVKWGLFRDSQWIIQNSVHHDQISNLGSIFRELPEPTTIIISHVAREETKKKLLDLIAYWSIEPMWHYSISFQCGVINGYSDPSQLGSDRWAALIASWNFEQRACLVVTAGTTVTIDALSDNGEFLGGIILPGFSLMNESLHSCTQLNCHESGIYDDFPINTKNAIYSGIIQCFIGAIERMHHILSIQIRHPNANCILSGGNSSILHPFIKPPVRIINNLVLEGLIVIAKDELKKQKMALP